MLKVFKEKLIYSFFSWYINRIIGQDFKNFSFNSPEFEQNKAILLLANHFSWWDGFLLFRLNQQHFKKRFYVMVTEENYAKVWFLKYMGAFPVKKNSREMVETLEQTGGLLNDPGNLVLIFPQGKLYSNHSVEIAFEKGLLKLVNSSRKNFQYVFSASFVDYFQYKKPTVTCYLTCWQGAEFTSLQLIKSAYNKHYEASRQQQSSIIV